MKKITQTVEIFIVGKWRILMKNKEKARKAGDYIIETRRLQGKACTNKSV